MSTISFHCDDVSFQWNEKNALRKWLRLIAREEKHVLQSLSFVYCSDESLLEMNRTHLSHDYFTDIITFDLSDSSVIEGEIYISIHRVSENAVAFGDSFEGELCRVMAHGLLHLCGYDDHTDADKSRMRAKETFYLSLLQEVPRGTFAT